eukprot:2586263-Amphidinium_carterae.1
MMNWGTTLVQGFFVRLCASSTRSGMTAFRVLRLRSPILSLQGMQPEQSRCSCQPHWVELTMWPAHLERAVWICPEVTLDFLGAISERTCINVMKPLRFGDFLRPFKIFRLGTYT